jgi:hypothetical protein
MHRAVDYDDATQFMSTTTPFGDGRADEHRRGHRSAKQNHEPSATPIQALLEIAHRVSCFAAGLLNTGVASGRPAEGNRNTPNEVIASRDLAKSPKR